MSRKYNGSVVRFLQTLCTCGEDILEEDRKLEIRIENTAGEVLAIIPCDRTIYNRIMFRLPITMESPNLPLKPVVFQPGYERILKYQLLPSVAAQLSLQERDLLATPVPTSPTPLNQQAEGPDSNQESLSPDSDEMIRLGIPYTEVRQVTPGPTLVVEAQVHHQQEETQGEE